MKEGGRWIDSVKRPSLKVSPSDPTDPSQLLSSQYYTHGILEILDRAWVSRAAQLTNDVLCAAVMGVVW